MAVSKKKKTKIIKKKTSKTKKVTKKVVKKKIIKRKPLNKRIKKIKKVKKLKPKKILKKKKLGKKVNKVKKLKIKLKKFHGNPIMGPQNGMYWESQAVFNPAAVYSGGRVHLFYRALGDDGISRIGYASSKDGLNFSDRLYYPVFSLNEIEMIQNHLPFTSPARLSYNRTLYASGGGWGGCEDPRAVIIDGRLYMSMNIFNGWNNMGISVVSMSEKDLLYKKWNWSQLQSLSHPGDRQKNWVIFPEKINGKFVVFHNLDKGDPNNVFVTFADNLNYKEMPTVKDAWDPQLLPDHIVAWHKRTRSASAPPIKTKDGWLLLYHAMDKDGSDRYKLGAMILDLKNPNKVLYRAQSPILEPNEWYENDWKPGIIYANGAVVLKGKLFVYYGGGDKHIGVASIKLDKLIEDIKKNIPIKLQKNKKIEIE